MTEKEKDQDPFEDIETLRDAIRDEVARVLDPENEKRRPISYAQIRGLQDGRALQEARVSVAVYRRAYESMRDECEQLKQAIAMLQGRVEEMAPRLFSTVIKAIEPDCDRLSIEFDTTDDPEVILAQWVFGQKVIDVVARVDDIVDALIKAGLTGARL